MCVYWERWVRRIVGRGVSIITCLIPISTAGHKAEPAAPWESHRGALWAGVHFQIIVTWSACHSLDVTCKNALTWLELCQVWRSFTSLTCAGRSSGNWLTCDCLNQWRACGNSDRLRISRKAGEWGSQGLFPRVRRSRTYAGLSTSEGSSWLRRTW